MLWFRSVAIAVACLSVLSACGGGGGDGTAQSNPSFIVSPTSLTFSASSNSGTTIASKTVTGIVSGVEVSTLYLNVQVTGNAVAAVGDIQITGPNTGTAAVHPISQHLLKPGTYTSTVTIIACTTNVTCATGRIGSPQIVNVTYTVNGLTPAESALTYSIGDTPAPSDLVRSISFTGYPVQNWQASSDVPWLSVSPASGNLESATTVTASLVSSQLNSATSGVYTGTVTLRPTQGNSISIPVTLTLNRSRVNFVAPYVAVANTSAEVIIRGENLGRYPTTGVRFGAVNAVSFTTVSDTEVRATHHPLPVGRYDIHLENLQGFDQTRASLVVVAEPTYAPASLPYTLFDPLLRPVCLAFDAERRALFASFIYTGSDMFAEWRVVRYSMDRGWNATAQATLKSPALCALTTDGQSLLVGALDPSNIIAGLTLSERDPVTLAIKQTTSNSTPGSGSASDVGGIAVANDGRAIFSYGSNKERVGAYSSLRPEITLYTGASAPNSYVAASGDGSLVLVGSGSASLLRYDATANRLVPTKFQANAAPVTLNRSGSRMVLSNAVYDSNFARFGTLPSSIVAAVLAPTAPVVYGFDLNGTVRRFDVSAPASGGALTEIVPGITFSNPPGYLDTIKMLITPDGHALFVAGSTRIVLVPLP